MSFSPLLFSRTYFKANTASARPSPITQPDKKYFICERIPEIYIKVLGNAAAAFSDCFPLLNVPKCVESTFRFLFFPYLCITRILHSKFIPKCLKTIFRIVAFTKSVEMKKKKKHVNIFLFT